MIFLIGRASGGGVVSIVVTSAARRSAGYNAQAQNALRAAVCRYRCEPAPLRAPPVGVGPFLGLPEVRPQGRPAGDMQENLLQRPNNPT